MELRLNKILSDSGYCSRREADKIIEEGRVSVNGKTAKVGMKVKETDIVEFDGATLKMKGAFKKARNMACECPPIINPKSADLRKTSKNNRFNKYQKLHQEDEKKVFTSKPWLKKKKEK